MKKIKNLFCGLLVGLSVLSYLIATQKNSIKELVLLNVEALSLNEDDVDGCVSCSGVCITYSGVYLGMAMAD